MTSFRRGLRALPLAALAAACTQPAPTEPSPAAAATVVAALDAAAAQDTTLKVWLIDVVDGDDGAFREVVKPFLAAHPYIDVAVETTDWEHAWQRLTRLVTGRRGEEPDIMQLGTTWVPTMAITGMLSDLTGTYDEHDFSPEALADTSLADEPRRRFAMPWLLDTRVVYYRKDACRKARVDPERDFATWAGFAAALKKLDGVKVNGKRLRPLVFGEHAAVDKVHSMSPWIWGAGGDYLARDRKTAAVASAAARAGVAFIMDLVHKRLATMLGAGPGDRSLGEVLAGGDFAVAISAPVAGLPTATFGATMLPAGPAGRFSFMGGSVLAISRASQHREEAIALLQYLSTVEPQVRYSRVRGYLPAARSSYPDPRIGEDEIQSVFARQLQYGRSYPSIPQWGAIELILQRRLGEIWEGRGDPGEVLAGAEREIDGVLHSRRFLSGLK